MNISSRLFDSRAWAAGLAATLALSLAAEAHAAPCASLPNPVYIAGSSAVKPFATALAAELAVQTPAITLIYSGPGSCIGVGYMTTNPPGKLTGGGTYWDTTVTPPAFTGACTTNDVAGGDPVNIGASDVYADSCGTPVASNVQDFLGPVQTMTFVVPIGASGGSTQTTISAEAAYLIYGFGGHSTVSPWIGTVTPWNDLTYILERNKDSGTEQMISAFIKVPATKWKGVQNGTSGNLVTALATQLTNGNAEKTIGILSTGDADKNRPSIRMLGLQYFGQSCTYLPDSTSTAFDKANVRDGHYPMWGNLHLYTPASGGVPTVSNVQTVIDYLTGKTTPTTFDLIKTEALAGITPDCAMKVKHTEAKDAAAVASYQPTHSCGCKFEFEAAKEAATPTGCHTCTAATGTHDATCPASTPTCNYGFCEVQ